MPGRPREFDRNEALASATDCFWSCGYEAASVAELLECMGISRQSAYDTFVDKRQLFRAALEAYVDHVSGEMRRVLTEGDSPLGRVRRFLSVVAERASAAGGRGCLMTNTIVELAPHDAEIRKAVSDVLRRLEDALAGNIEAARKAGELPADVAPRAAARLIVTLMQGALVLSKTELAAGVREAMEQAGRMLFER